MDFLQYVSNGYALCLGITFIIYLILRKTKVLDIAAARKKDESALVEYLKSELEKKNKTIEKGKSRKRVKNLMKYGKQSDS